MTSWIFQMLHVACFAACPKPKFLCEDATTCLNEEQVLKHSNYLNQLYLKSNDNLFNLLWFQFPGL